MDKSEADTSRWDEQVDRILTAYNAVSRSINPTQMLKVDLTSSQIKVMASFAEQPGFTMTELSRVHNVSISTMTSMVDRLIQNGLLERRRDERDRRIVRVSMTAKGRQLVKHVMKVRRHELEKFLQELSTGEVTRFVEAIETVAEYMTKAKSRLLRQ